tara:strand:+ start:606 stop:947 length:342 start_codon:yes stop_codon:yes gene_type:complete
MKAICIDSSNKPEGISDYEWIEEGVVYTITEVVELALQKGKLGVAFEEIQLTDASAPYKYYSLERFLIIPENFGIRFGDITELDLNNLPERNFTKLKKEVDAYEEDADLTNSI